MPKISVCVCVCFKASLCWGGAWLDCCPALVWFQSILACRQTQQAALGLVARAPSCNGRFSFGYGIVLVIWSWATLLYLAENIKPLCDSVRFKSRTNNKRNTNHSLSLVLPRFLSVSSLSRGLVLQEPVESICNSWPHQAEVMTPFQ